MGTIGPEVWDPIRYPWGLGGESGMMAPSGMIIQEPFIF